VRIARGFAALVGLQPLHEVHVQRLDGVRIFARGGFDFDAAIARCNEGQRFCRTVDQHRQVKLLGDIGGLRDQHAVDRQGHTGGLVGFHFRAQHSGRVLFHLVEVFRELDAAGLAAPAGMDLRLDHPRLTTDGAGRLHGLVSRARNATRWNRDAIHATGDKPTQPILATTPDRTPACLQSP
jgi:hypothetical protein